MLNRIDIMGRLTKDPELRTTQAQVPVVSFTVAVDRDFGKDENGGRQTDFIDCTAWRQTAEFVNRYFHKGSMAVVSGRLQSRAWEDRNGQKRVSWEINVENIYFGESRAAGTASGQTGPDHAQPVSGSSPFAGLHPVEDDGPLPF